MTYIVGFISQKGGVGKSSLARTLAVEMAKAGMDTHLCDLDQQQSTSANWAARRGQHGHSPEIPASTMPTVKSALKLATTVDALILDGKAHSSDQSLEIAQASDLIVIPVGTSLDDLEPTVKIAYALEQRGVPASKICFAICRTTSDSEEAGARGYLSEVHFRLLDGATPEKPSIKKTLDAGKSLTETSFKSVNSTVDLLMQAIIDTLASEGE